jgi:osmotically-inducible protein OsmY
MASSQPEYIDPDIAADAVQALDRNVNVPSDRIGVTVKDGCLTLEGKVGWGYQKEAAEQSCFAGSMFV